MARAEEIACKQGCGKTFAYESWRVKHELSCKGKVATRGRIERLASKRGTALVPVSRPQTRGQNRKRSNDHVDRTPPAIGTGAIVAAATDKAVEIVIAGLRAKRDAIDVAIAALQAVS